MKSKSFTLLLLLVFSLFSAGQVQGSEKYTENVQAADRQLLLENYGEAADLYNQAKSYATNVNEKSYIHYRLGSIYMRLNDKIKAQQEWRDGLDLLEREGVHSGIEFHLKQALLNNGL
ncbi:hypothetical protein [Emcibacter nanhaiensis]|uniref:Tetratricopeptide repeat protein n=1 Tax=Emcibacter nanhaiensis TaxID=1505037 RepID=A0A501PG16_9PROT|nr:hypothetical protein [Emcibacter nanhaiensis]TPD59380.1 hypothetical protein FIV46_11340 [Emcibacter nanhaiensis]